MTADRLDAETEARIREACPRSDMPTHDPFACHFCRIQRAAILADREARECHDRNHAGLREWLCGWRGKERFDPKICGPKEWMGQDVALAAHQVAATITDERAHADALAKALRPPIKFMATQIELEREDTTDLGWDGAQPATDVNRARLEWVTRGQAALAAHDKLRVR